MADAKVDAPSSPLRPPAHYPSGAAPVVRGEAVNTATTYGYDSVTMMQETKTTICNIERATA